jgi:hypothetical protein
MSATPDSADPGAVCSEDDIDVVLRYSTVSMPAKVLVDVQSTDTYSSTAEGNGLRTTNRDPGSSPPGDPSPQSWIESMI